MRGDEQDLDLPGLNAQDIRMKKTKITRIERKCPACNGTGFPTVKQPAKPGRKIYPPPCVKCEGMGRMREAAS
jgi:DnaJ-class molecular chaperone